MSIQDALPKSRLTLRYRTEIHGQREDIELPLRLLVMGDFSGPYSKKEPLEERDILCLNGKNTAAVMEKMRIFLKVQDSDEQEHRIPLTNIDSFQPEEISENVSSLQSLLEGRKVLKDVLSIINNSKKFRASLMERISDQESIESIKKRLGPLYKDCTTIPVMSTSVSEQ